MVVDQVFFFQVMLVLVLVCGMLKLLLIVNWFLIMLLLNCWKLCVFIQVWLLLRVKLLMDVGRWQCRFILMLWVVLWVMLIGLMCMLYRWLLLVWVIWVIVFMQVGEVGFVLFRWQVVLLCRMVFMFMFCIWLCILMLNQFIDRFSLMVGDYMKLVFYDVLVFGLSL